MFIYVYVGVEKDRWMGKGLFFFFNLYCICSVVYLVFILNKNVIYIESIMFVL